MENTKKRVRREPTNFEGYLAIVLMLVIIGGGSGVLGLNLKMMLVVTAAVNMVFAWYLGADWNEMQGAIVNKITDMAGCFLILLGIGFFIGTSMVSGTIPLLVSLLAKLISPKICLLLSFVLLAILALAIGSSFAAMGTLGIVMFSVGTLQGIPAGIEAAAVICGSWFGQYISPVADIVNCASQINKITVNEFMKQMVKPLAIATVITAAFYTVLGFRYGSADGNLESVANFIADVQANFNTNPILILPLLIAIVLSVLKVNTVTVLFGSGFVAIILGIIFQGYDVSSVMEAAYSGYSSDVFLAGTEISPELASLVNRGGIFSMADGICFLFCALACVGLMDVIGVFAVIQRTIFRGTTKSGPLALISTVAIAIFGLVTADPFPPVIIGGELLKGPYKNAGIHPKKGALISLSTGLLMTLCLPWSFCAWYSGNIYGVTIGEFFPYAILFPLVPIIIVILSFFKVGDDPLPADFDAEE